MFKVDNENTRTIMTLIFSLINLVFSLLTWDKYMPAGQNIFVVIVLYNSGIVCQQQKIKECLVFLLVLHTSGIVC